MPSTPITAALAPLSGTVAAEAAVPLCVDLDGTLVRSDMLVEGVFALATDWRILPSLLLLLSSGRAAFKERIATLAAIDPALLPYNETLIGFLKEQKAVGRRLVLATAADRQVAQAIAGHLGLFDEIVASDGTRNLKGAAKAAALVERFGEKGFAYAGNDRSDLAVWRVAKSAVVVNAPGAVAAAARAAAPVEAAIDDRPSRPRALLRAMRPHQWVKNFLVLVPIITAHALLEAEAWIGAALAFAAFCATASAIYVVNDLLDLADDRRHPRKRLRPFASGAIPLPAGIALAAILLVLGLSLAATSGALAVVVLYAVLSLGYSMRLKELPLVDVFILAGLYTIRLFGGGEATGHPVSLWLLGFSSFLFLSLALVKRVEELTAAARVGGRSGARRGYVLADAQLLQLFGCCAAFASSLVLALFVQSEATAQRYASPGLLWGIVPLMLFWQCRLWLATARGHMHDDPIVYAARDWVSWTVVAALVLLLAVAKSVPVFPP